MNIKDIKEKVADALATENPPGTHYYGAEVDESGVEAARERREKKTHMNQEVGHEGETPTTPATPDKTP